MAAGAGDHDMRGRRETDRTEEGEERRALLRWYGRKLTAESFRDEGWRKEDT